jgi:hypothetical protein
MQNKLEQPCQSPSNNSASEMKLELLDVYQDNFIDLWFIRFFSSKIANILNLDKKVTSYQDFVELSKEILVGRNAQQQQLIVEKVLDSFIPAPILASIRFFFSPTQTICELNAWFATKLFQWLVGPCDLAETEIQLKDGTSRIQNSAVQIRKCRYLEETVCVGLCVNICKAPTQKFFTEKFGIPVTMTPNFEDLSCKMIFGEFPPSPENDPAYQQVCMHSKNPNAKLLNLPCHKLSS